MPGLRPSAPALAYARALMTRVCGDVRGRRWSGPP